MLVRVPNIISPSSTRTPRSPGVQSLASPRKAEINYGHSTYRSVYPEDDLTLANILPPLSFDNIEKPRESDGAITIRSKFGRRQNPDQSALTSIRREVSEKSNRKVTIEII
jgi:hypothetical protein